VLRARLDVNGDVIHDVKIVNVGGDLDGWSDYEVSLDDGSPVEVSHWRPDGALRLLWKSLYALGVVKSA
jgi:hypothetical protein